MSEQTVSDVTNRSRLPAVRARIVDWLRTNTGTFVVLAFLLTAWEGYTQLFVQNDLYLPSLTFTVEQTLENSDQVIEGIRVTFTEVLVAFPLAVTVGVVVGIVFAESFVIRQLSMPVLIFAYGIPHAILAPLFLIWFGTGLRGLAIFAAWLAFFPVFINTFTGVSRIDPELQQLSDITGATRWQRLRYIKFWTALPEIISSIKIAIQMTIVGVIIAEFLATGGGLGYLIIKSTQRAQIGLTFGTVIVIMLFAIVLYKVVSTALEAVNPH